MKDKQKPCCSEIWKMFYRFDYANYTFIRMIMILVRTCDSCHWWILHWMLFFLKIASWYILRFDISLASQMRFMHNTRFDWVLKVVKIQSYLYGSFNACLVISFMIFFTRKNKIKCIISIRWCQIWYFWMLWLLSLNEWQQIKRTETRTRK